MQGHHGAVEELLLLPNILVNTADKAGATALMLASGFGHEEVVHLLLDHPDIKVNAVGNLERTALFWASGNGHTVQQHFSSRTVSGRHEGVLMLFLSRHDIDVNAADWLASSALSAASRLGCEGTVKLLSHPDIRNVNAADVLGRTVLFHATYNWRLIHPIMDSFIGFDLTSIIFGAQNDPSKDETASYDQGNGGTFYCVVA
ncbi:ankyrin repeat-containing domain protein [Coprinopsis sp. MPI-PUGE-AT-0042]|nr:ankyrin repeat-containing domain protein [Coprinopsis sp. MPI-PUGE-AT-0042]